jgi:hypothetical protein
LCKNAGLKIANRLFSRKAGLGNDKVTVQIETGD